MARTAKNWLARRDAVNEEAALRRELSLRQPVYFDSHYCAMRYAPHRKRWLGKLASEWARARASLRTSEPVKSKLLMLGPRDHGKTEVVITFATEVICQDRGIRVLFASEAASNAVKRVGRVKDLLLSERIQEDWCSAPEEGYGPFLPPKFDKDDRIKWSESVVQVLRDVRHVDPTIEAVGAGKKVTGSHYDLIILDDPEDYASVASPTMRARRRLWLKSTIMPMLAPGGLMVMIGTRKHHDDLYAHALKDPTWRVIKDQAVIKWPDKATPVYALDEYGRQVIEDWEIEGDHEVLWPAERPIKYLLTMRAEMGATNFAREMQNEVADEATVSFRMEWLEAACTRGRDVKLSTGPWPRDLLIVQGWDPAFVVDKRKAETGDTDFSVGITLGASVRTRDRYLMDITRERGDTKVAKVNNVLRFWRAWAPPVSEFELDICDHVKGGWAFAVAMEKNNAGEFLSIDCGEKDDIPLVRHWTGPQVSDPFKGVPVLSSLFELGKFVLPYGSLQTIHTMDTVIAEFHELGTAAHDDIVLSTWIAEVLLRRALALYDRFVEQNGAPEWLLAA